MCIGEDLPLETFRADLPSSDAVDLKVNPPYAWDSNNAPQVCFARDGAGSGPLNEGEPHKEGENQERYAQAEEELLRLALVQTFTSVGGNSKSLEHTRRHGNSNGELVVPDPTGKKGAMPEPENNRLVRNVLFSGVWNIGEARPYLCHDTVRISPFLKLMPRARQSSGTVCLTRA